MHFFLDVFEASLNLQNGIARQHQVKETGSNVTVVKNRRYTQSPLSLTIITQTKSFTLEIDTKSLHQSNRTW